MAVDTGPSAGLQQLLADMGAALVNAAEKRICGAGAVDSAAAAQGVALAGRRAANLVREGTSTGPPFVLETKNGVSWVHHRLADGQAKQTFAAAVELVASSVQQAVDHCLAAHVIGQHISQPGICHIDDTLAGQLSAAYLPGQQLVDELLGKGPASTGKEPVHDPTEVTKITLDVLRAVGDKTGREISPLMCHQTDDAEFVLVTLGWVSESVKAAVDLLRSAGIKIGVVSLTVLRPFPSEELGKIFKGSSCVAVIEPPSLRRSRGEIFHRLVKLAPKKKGKASSLVRVPCPLPDHDDQAFATQIMAILSPKAKAPTFPKKKAPAANTRLTIAAAPGGYWGQSLLLDLTSHLARFRPVSLRPIAPKSSGFSALLLHEPDAAPIGELTPAIDIAILPHYASLDTKTIGPLLKKGGTIVFQSSCDTARELWHGLNEAQQQLVKSNNLNVWWVDAEKLSNDSETPSAMARCALLGAALHALKETKTWVTGKKHPARTVADHLEKEGGRQAVMAAWLRKGADATNRVDADTMSAAISKPEESFLTRSGALGLLKQEVDEGSVADWRLRLRRFHLNAKGTRGVGDPSLGLPLRPAVTVRDTLSQPSYPYVLPTGDGANQPEPLSDLFTRACEELDANGTDVTFVAQHLRRLLSTANQVVDGANGSVSFEEGIGEILKRFVATFDVSDSAEEELDQQVETFKAHLALQGELLGFGPHVPIRLFAWAVESERQQQRAEFATEVRGLLNRLDDILRSDQHHSEEATSEKALAKAMGNASSAFFDAKAMAKTLPSHRGAKRLEPERRARIESVIEILSRQLNQGSDAPAFYLVHADPLPVGAQPNAGTSIAHCDALMTAKGLFDGFAASMAEVFRAIRTAQLELNEQYEPEIHDELLAGFGWQSCTNKELALLPPILVVERAQRLNEHSLAALSTVLRSARPIQILVEDDSSWGTATLDAGIEANIALTAMAHRESCVAQSTLARPSHLFASIRRMVQVPRPAMTAYAVPDADDPMWLSIVGDASVQGRATPCFRFDPDAGPTWADRFDLSDNPQAEAAWPSVSVPYVDGDEQEATLDLRFTFADAAGLQSELRSHFWVIPIEGWSDKQLDVATYLDSTAKQQLSAIPFIWVVDEDGVLQRAVVTRELVFACWDRLQSWRTLQELAGVDNEYAKRAAATARQEAEAEAAEQKGSLEATFNVELERVRAEAAGEAMERLANVLLNLDTAMPATAPASAPAAAPVVEAALAKAEEAPVEDEEEEVSFDDPFIDTFLCTSCNDCLDLNPMLFKYDGNKQAFIDDPSAGTFAELVQAAEKCPARCIHPGKPRSGDDTATDDLVKRASAFA